MDDLQAEFDRAAGKLAARRGRGRSPRWLDRLGLEHVPSPCGEALEIGCGIGNLARRLAPRCDRVLALDLSPEMIRIARARSTAHPNIEYRVADVTSWEFPVERFDCIVSVAALHHMPLEPILLKSKAALRAGGVLLIFDLYQPAGVRAALLRRARMTAGLVRRLVPRRRHDEPERVWGHHADEAVLSMRDLREICGRVLPGARVKEYLGAKRYSITWTKPA
jgi:SAM-dependent methyltransferase